MGKARELQLTDVVVFNNFFPDRQGEVDIVALKRGRPGEPRTVWLCEVTTHIRGMLLIRANKDETEQLVREKVGRLREYAALVFPDELHRFEWWSPYVPIGKTTTMLNEVVAELQGEGVDFSFVINDDYTERVRELVGRARDVSATTGEPAFRLLQVLARLRGGKLSV